MHCHRLGVAGLVALSLLAAGNVSAQSTGSLIHLIVPAGTPLRLALDEKITIRKAGQRVTATLLEPVYAFDRIVVPAGGQAIGHINRIPTAPMAAGALAGLSRGVTSPPPALLVGRPIVG